MSVFPLISCAMHMVEEYPPDWDDLVDIERRRLINMYLNAFALHHYGLNSYFVPRVLVQPPPPPRNNRTREPAS